MAFPTKELQIQRFANALYNVQLGSETMDSVLAGTPTYDALNDTFNYVYQVSFGGMTSAQVAETVLANFGIVSGQYGLTDEIVAATRLYVTNLIASTPANARGAMISSLATTWAGLTGDPTFGAAATAWNAEIDDAMAWEGTDDVVAGTDNPAPPVITEFFLTANQDIIAGSAGSDTFFANVVQVNGPQVNSLGTGDSLNGLGGIDLLAAQITKGVFLGNVYGDGNMPVAPTTVGIENVELDAIFSSLDYAYGDDVFFSAKYMRNVDFIGSDYSDADLIIQDLTVDANEVTSSMTIGMAYTGNADHMWDASDLAVYFDEDDLIPDGPLQVGNSLFYAMLDQINFDINPNDAVNGPPTGQPLEEFKLIQVAFSVNGVEKFLDVTQADLARIAAVDTFIGQYQEMVEVLNEKLVADVANNPGFAELVFELTSDQFFAEPFDGTWGYWIELTNRAGFSNVLTDAEISVDDTSPERNPYWNVRNTDPSIVEQLITVQVELEKAGRGGDGGELIIGGMNKGEDNIWGEGSNLKPAGVEQFNVTVLGGALLPNSLAALESTNNALQVVNVASDNLGQVGYASLQIGNSNTTGQLGTLDGNAEALKDVQIFNASNFLGDLTVFAALTSEVTAKYMDLQDDQIDPAADNIEFIYTLGQGNDFLNLVIDNANLDHAGTTTREDFELQINGGAGDDVIETMIGTGEGVDTDAWYINSRLNNTNNIPADVNPVEYLRIDAGAGNDVVRTFGAGDFVIDAGADNDTVYAENTGDMAQWKIWPIDPTTGNIVSNPNYANLGLLTDGVDLDILFTATIAVTFKGLVSTVTATMPTTGITHLELMQLVKDAINNDSVLNQLLTANDGPANTLIVDSLIDGDMLPGDLVINLRNETGGNFVLGMTQTLVGANGAASSDNQITPGLGNDVIVLGTAALAPAEDNDNVIYTVTGSGNDVIVNFVAADASGVAQVGNDTIDFSALTGAAALFVDAAWSAVDGSVTVVAETVLNDTAAEIKALFDATIEEDTVVSQHIYIAVDANNVGSAYLIEDGAALFDSVVTLIGNIDLADTNWFDLAQVNFV